MFTRIIDDELELALPQPSFAPRYLELVNTQRDYLAQWLAWPTKAHNEAFFASFIRNAVKDYADGNSMVCAIIYQGEVVGNCSFNRLYHDLKKAEVGYWLSESHQGKGIMTRVVKTLIDIAFSELHMEKVELSAAVNNTASRAVAERCGMQLEAVLSHQEKIGERILDHAIYSVTRN
ncbi:GNAT family N-acetyltransferase [Vibrio proteolyticus]|uniref:Putative acetyltransferase n=1 Tax=Vibrio proteolyticus NBRC 13287 TaxID=1219065 RepID=U3A5X1_VIBPR|nr:GNAT family protein [Vibrio proteolyticus]GAD68727.1 putative acetyltransferase [Vibrio proteolyticus NBRC 13287]